MTVCSAESPAGRMPRGRWSRKPCSPVTDDASAALFPSRMAVSRRGSNEEAFEGFSWGEESEARAGPVVEFFGDGAQVGLVVGDRGALGQILADQPVGVLVRAPFPGRAGVGEEHARVCPGFG